MKDNGAGEGIRTSAQPGRAEHQQRLEGSAALRMNNGAGEGIRTLDPNLGKVVLYP